MTSASILCPLPRRLGDPQLCCQFLGENKGRRKSGGGQDLVVRGFCLSHSFLGRTRRKAHHRRLLEREGVPRGSWESLLLFPFPSLPKAGTMAIFRL